MGYHRAEETERKIGKYFSQALFTFSFVLVEDYALPFAKLWVDWT
jgi:hypothetical protein